MIKEAIVKIVSKGDLSYDEAYTVMNEIMSGETTPTQNAAFLAALSTKSAKAETTDEIAGCAAAMRDHATKVETGMDVFEIVGTGGDGAHSFNISTTAAIVVASAGVMVAKHGNRSVSSKSGSSDLLAAFGINLDMQAEKSRTALDELGVCFLFAPKYHTGFRHAMPVRQQLKTRTLFNVLGPLINPAHPPLALIGVYYFCAFVLGLRQNEHAVRSYLPVRVVATFVFLFLFRTYRTVWSRAVGSNYFRLLLACVFGSVAGTVFLYYWPSADATRVNAMTFAYLVVSFSLLVVVRVFRGFVRDLFYAIDCSRLRNRKDVSRILVYGAGLRYKSFRRELVRTTSANDRMIVGLLDDDVYLKGKYIGGIRIYGTINDAPEVINALNVDAVVIACVVSDEWLKVVKDILAPTGVKVTRFSFAETQV